MIQKIQLVIKNIHMRTFLFFLGISFIVFMFLANTVHKNQYRLRPSNIYNHEQKVSFWINDGYFSSGGLFGFESSLENNPSQRSKSFITTIYLFPMYLMQKINFLYNNNKYSLKITTFYSQIMVGIAAALLGFLSFLISDSLESSRINSLLLSVGSLIIFQTFPWNLFQYWRFYPTYFFVIFMLIFLIVTFIESEEDFKPKRTLNYIKWASVFFMVPTDIVSTVYFLFSYFFILFLFNNEETKEKSILTQVKIILKFQNTKSIIGALFISLFFFKGWLLYFKIKYPQIFQGHTEFLIRTGLDGSLQYYTTHLDLLARNSYIPMYAPEVAKSLANWKFLFFIGVFGILVLLIISAFNKKIWHKAIMVFVPLLAYILFAFMFSQTAITHPFGYDVYLLIPLILATFAFLPSLIIKYSNNNSASGVVVLFFCTLAIVISFIQLRHYVVCFPLSNS